MTILDRNPSVVLNVGVVFESDPTAGGSASYARNVFDLLGDLQNNSNVRFQGYIVGKQRNENSSPSVIPISYVKPMFAQSFRTQLLASGLGVLIARKLRLIRFPLEQAMIKDGMNIAYFLSPNEISLGFSQLPIISTVWDLGHRELVGFPEVTNNFEWQYRENLYNQTLARSIHVFVDSINTGKKIEKLYSVSPSNWTSLGLFPSVSALGKAGSSMQISKPFFIYPAQKWFHKNHNILLEALLILKQKGITAQLVFTGSDKGSGQYISSRIAELDISDQIEDLGFVDEAKLNLLISESAALVMPTFLGPTNLPPLEAALLGTRVLASDIHDFDQEDLVGIDLTLIPADSASGWANAMQKCLEEPKQQKEYKPRDPAQILSKVFESLSKKIANWLR